MMWFIVLGACTGEPASENPADPACEAGEVWDGATCAPEACGAAPWGDAPLDDDTVFVQQGAEGDGSEGSPYGSILDALDAEGDDAHLRVAAGEYLGRLDLGRAADGLRIEGRCPALVSIVGDDAELSVVRLEGYEATISMSGVTITGGHWGVSVSAGTVVADDVSVTGNGKYGISAADSRARIELTDSVVAGNANEEYGMEVSADDGATLVLERVGITTGVGFGMYAGDGATLDASSISVDARASDVGGGIFLRGALVDIEDATITGGGADAIALTAYSGASLTVRRSTVADTRGFGVVTGGETADETQTLLELDTVEFLNVGEPGGDERTAIGIRGWTRATLTSVTVTNDAGLAVIVDGDRDDPLAVPDVTIDGLTIIDTYANDPEQPAAAVAVAVTAGTLHGSGLTVDGCVGIGLVARYAGSVVDLEDVDLTGISLGAVYLLEGASVTLTGGRIHDVAPLAYEAIDPGTTLTVQDVDLDTIVAGPWGTSGLGAYVWGGAEMYISGGTWTGIAGEAGSATGDGAVLDVRDLTVTDSQLSFNDLGAAIGGFSATFWSTLRMENVSLEGGYGPGVTVGVAEAELSNVSIRDYASGGSLTLAWGVAATEQASLTMTDVSISGIGGHGMLIGGGTTDCTRCDVSDVEFAGVQLTGVPQDPGYIFCWDPDASTVLWCLDPSDCASYEVCTSQDPGPTRLTLVDSAIDGVGVSPRVGGGVGVLADDSWGPTELVLDGTSIAGTTMASVFLESASSVRIVGGSVIEAAAPVDVGGLPAYGAAVFATGTVPWDGEHGLLIEDTALDGSSGVGAVFLDGASATLSGNEWSGNTTDVLQQLCEGVVSPPPGDEGWGTERLCPDHDEPVLDFGAYFFTYAAPEAG